MTDYLELAIEVVNRASANNIEAEAVIRSTTDPNGVFLRRAQTGHRFPRATDLRFRSADRVGDAASRGSDTAEMREKIQCHTLRG